jgi:hypothetical protein
MFTIQKYVGRISFSVSYVTNCYFCSMANTIFDFKQFRIKQDRCAMKVGTDGVLLQHDTPDDFIKI